MSGFSKLTELKKDFAKVVRVSRPCEQAYIAYYALGGVASEYVFLHVGDALHHKADGKHDDAYYVACGPKLRLIELRDVWRIEHCHRQRDDPHP